MFDFRLRVFHTVAKRLNFTKAAQELYITQPAVTKHIQELERHFKTNLFERKGSKIALTQAGSILLQHTETLFELHRKIESDIHALTNSFKGQLRIGASTTIANYILPKVLPEFTKSYPEIEITVHQGNTEEIERSLSTKNIDLGITEGFSKATQWQYLPFLKDEIVLVCKQGHPLLSKGGITLSMLLDQPLVIREHGSGTLDVIAHALQNHGLDLSNLKVVMQLESSESIKNYLMHSECLAFLSVHTLLTELKQQSLSILDVQNLDIERQFFFVLPQGQPQPLVALFQKFALSHNYR